MEYTQLVGGRGLLKLDRLAVEQVGFLALGEQLIERAALRQQLVADRGMAGQLGKSVVISWQAQAEENFAALLAVLFKQHNQRLFARQDFFQQTHVPAVEGQGFFFEQLEQMLRRRQIINDQL